MKSHFLKADNIKIQSVVSNDVSNSEKHEKHRNAKKKQFVGGHFKHKSQRERKRELSESKNEPISPAVKKENVCPW